jgi:squalene cyclase
LHALGAIARLKPDPANIGRAIDFVLSHQTTNGGFSTYKDGLSLLRYRGGGDEFSYRGWTQPHVCVTAVAVEVLTHFPHLVSQPVLDNAIGFILDSQTLAGYWESYWWRSKYFSTTRILKYLNRLNTNRAKAARDKAVEWVLGTASTRGYWDNGYDLGKPCPLSTSQCVEALLVADAGRREAIDGIAWLLENQNDDGSWTGAPVLQIPPPDVTEPFMTDNWRVGGRGVGACSADERRVYTTASVVSVLSLFS